MDRIRESLLTAEARIDNSHYRTVIMAGDHTIVSDEPWASGGADEGISPQGLLLASLGSCTAITLRMYIDRKMWPVDEIIVGMEMFKESEDRVIAIQLNFKGSLSEEQKSRLVQIAEACPIHKMLACKIIIETGLK